MEIIQGKINENGLNFIIANMPQTKSVTAVVGTRAGWRYETQSNHGVAHFLEHMAFKGTRKRPKSIGISREVEGVGGDMNANTSEELTKYYISVPQSRADVSLDILSDMMTNSLFDPTEIEVEKGAIIQEYRMYADNPKDSVGFILWPRLLYGDHPLGWCGVGTEKSVQEMNRGHFQQFHSDLYTAENTVVTLAGSFPDPVEAVKKLAGYFTEINGGAPKIKKRPVVEKQDQPGILIETRDITQCHLVLGFRAFSWFDDRRYPLQVLSAILGGNMSSRIFNEVREKRGLAYYAWSYLDFMSDCGAIAALAGVDRDKTEEALTVIMAEFKKMAEIRVTDQELALAKGYLTGREERSAELPSHVAADLANQWLRRGKIVNPEEFVERINSVTADDIRNVALDIFKNDRLNLALIGPNSLDRDRITKIISF